MPALPPLRGPSPKTTTDSTLRPPPPTSEFKVPLLLKLFGAWAIVSAIASVGLTAFVVWAVYRLVMHFTGG